MAVNIEWTDLEAGGEKTPSVIETGNVRVVPIKGNPDTLVIAALSNPVHARIYRFESGELPDTKGGLPTIALEDVAPETIVDLDQVHQEEVHLRNGNSLQLEVKPVV